MTVSGNEGIGKYSKQDVTTYGSSVWSEKCENGKRGECVLGVGCVIMRKGDWKFGSMICSGDCANGK